MSKSRTNKFIDTIDECLTNGVDNGIFQVSLEDNSLNGRQVTIDGKSVVNFGSCSYLGLEVDERLKQGAIDATIRYGTQYSSSRLFSACNLYEEIEDLFYKIFGNNPSLLAATTTLTHMGALPILVQDDDLIILDHQVHGSVQIAVQLVKARGTKVDMIKHNRMDMLEDMIKENPNKYNKIWYMADGLYSMYGDFAPVKDLIALMEKYGNFHVYIDDAHGMSWAGKHGSGYIMSQVPLHPKMVLTTSLAKGFGTGGGVTVVTDPEMRRKIMTCGGSYTFSGPVQPPMLGASIASAKIHLSDEIYTLQNELKEKIELTRSIIEKYELPLVLPSDSPIFYIGLGLPRVGYNMVKRLLKEGFYTNIGIFPGVPVKCSGLRLAVTNGQTKDDIKNVLDAFQHHFPKVLEEEGQTIDDISNNFNLPFEETKKHYVSIGKNDLERPFDIQHETTIHNIDKELWDELLGDNGTFDWEGCRLLEETFCDNLERENNWELHYLIINDKAGIPVLATFFSVLLAKDDMIAPSNVSQQIENMRLTNKYYLTSKVVMMGSLLSVGNHLYINKKNFQWIDAILHMIEIMKGVKKKSGAMSIHLRDIDSLDIEIRDVLIKEGFIKVEMPDVHVVENLTWDSVNSYLESLSVNNRRNLSKTVIQTIDEYDVVIRKSSVGCEKVEDEILESEIKYWYELYGNVKKGSFNLNTFDIPIKFFYSIINNPQWDVFELWLAESTRPVAVVFCQLSSKMNYSPTVIGLDYDYVLTKGCYRQGVFQSILRANKLKCKRVYLGMDASIEKQKFGSRILPKCVYIQADDNFNMELISTVYHNKISTNEKNRI
jgi:7-keto-8-aminopelargonate synthetase-like enzyme/predicted N-acyltransferase